MLIMIVPKPPEYDKQNLKSSIEALAKELKLIADINYEIPNGNTSEEELKAIFDELRAEFLKAVIEGVFLYVKQFPFDDLFTDERSMLEYMIKLFNQK